MKKIALILAGLFVFNFAFSQHFVPLKLSISPDDFNMAGYGGFSLDKGSEPEFIRSLSNTAQSGFIVNALYSKMGGSLLFHQFMIDINPIIINWDPFTWNKLVSQPIDSFYVQKMPFAEDAFLHIGWHMANLKKIYGKRTKNEYRLFKLFSEVYYRPYSLDKNGVNYRFASFNIVNGLQFGYVQKEVPVLGNFLIALSAQYNFMLVNEQDNYMNNFTALTKYNDKLFMGPGGKLTVQTNFLNIYIEGRQYFGMHTHEKFTTDPTILVGAFGNISWTSHKKSNGSNDVQFE